MNLNEINNIFSKIENAHIFQEDWLNKNCTKKYDDKAITLAGGASPQIVLADMNEDGILEDNN